jgi:mRNA-degrading endonuclease toxin of MazEF toxin-antitoxin module
MSLEELKIYIKERNIVIIENVKLFSDYFHDLIQQYDLILKTNNSNDMRQCAYDIKNTSENAEWSYNKQLINDTIKTRPFTIPKRGEIWTCQFGKNIGSEENKIRPVIIIQNNTGNEKGPTTIVVPISNRPAKILTHILLKNSDYVLVEGEKGEITGTIMCEQIRVISKVRLGRHIGTLDREFVNKILCTKLKKSLNL